MSNVIEVNDSNFEEEVLKSELPVLVDFTAPWCSPCQKQLPIIEKFASENLNKVKVCKVDVDELPRIATKLNIKGVPSIVLFDNGKKVDMKVGLTSSAALSSFLLEKIGSIKV